MDIVAQVAEAMQTVLTTEADRIGRESGFIQRQKQGSGSVFGQRLVFSWLAKSQGSLGEMAQRAGGLGGGSPLKG